MRTPGTLILASLFALSACGQSVKDTSVSDDMVIRAEESASAKATKPGKGVTLTLKQLDATKRSTMVIGGCTLVYEATNTLKDEIKYLTINYRPVPGEGNLTGAAYVEARGDARIYFGALKPGETRESFTTFEGFSCESFAGVDLLTKTCGLKSGDTCADDVTVKSALSVPLQTRF